MRGPRTVLALLCFAALLCELASERPFPAQTAPRVASLRVRML